jgi:hypothetical protein
MRGSISEYDFASFQRLHCIAEVEIFDYTMLQKTPTRTPLCIFEM